SAVNQSVRQMGSVFGVALVVVVLGNADGPAAIASFKAHFLVLVAGGLVTALLSLPIDTRHARVATATRPQPVTLDGPLEQSNKSLHPEHTPFIKCPDASSRASRSAAG